MASGNIDIILTANGAQFAREMATAQASVTRFSLSVSGLSKILKSAGLVGSGIGIGIGIARSLRGIFAAGIEGAEALRKRAADRGGWMNAFDAERISEASQAIAQLRISLEQLSQTLAATVGPAVRDFAWAWSTILGSGESPGAAMLERMAAGETVWRGVRSASSSDMLRAQMGERGGLIGLGAMLFDPFGGRLERRVRHGSAELHPLFDPAQRALRRAGWTDEMIARLRFWQLPTYERRGDVFAPGFAASMEQYLPEAARLELHRQREAEQEQARLRRNLDEARATLLRIRMMRAAQRGFLQLGAGIGWLDQRLGRGALWAEEAASRWAASRPHRPSEPGLPTAALWGTTEGYDAFLRAQTAAQNVEQQQLREQRRANSVLEAIRNALRATVIAEIPVG